MGMYFSTIQIINVIMFSRGHQLPMASAGSKMTPRCVHVPCVKIWVVPRAREVTAPTRRPPPAALDNALLTVREVYSFLSLMPSYLVPVFFHILVPYLCSYIICVYTRHSFSQCFADPAVQCQSSVGFAGRRGKAGQGATGHTTFLPAVVDTLHPPALPSH